MRRALYSAIATASFCSAVLAVAQPDELPRQIAIDAGRFDPEKTEFALVNVGASDAEPWMVGGHLVLVARSDLGEFAFDWGIFDSEKPNFMLNYMRGILEYEHIVRPAKRFMKGVRSEGRAAVLRPLKLTTDQKKRVQAELVVWRQPGNLTYAYDVVAKNCATVIRDILTAAIGPNFKEDLKTSAGMSARGAGRLAFGHAWYVYLLGEAAFGSKIDVLHDKWDLVYLPLTFPRMLGDLPAYDDAGARIPGSKLLLEPETIIEGTSLPVSSSRWTLWIGLGLAAVIAGLLAKRWLLPFRVLAGFCGVFFGISSIVVILLWSATRHVMTHDNYNLGFYWPVDFALLGFAFGVEKSKKLVLRLAAAHLGVGLILVILWAVGVVAQDLFETATLVLPLWAAVGFMVWSASRASVTPTAAANVAK